MIDSTLFKPQVNVAVTVLVDLLVHVLVLVVGLSYGSPRLKQSDHGPAPFRVRH